jgi:hypothetical protein
MSAGIRECARTVVFLAGATMAHVNAVQIRCDACISAAELTPWMAIES